ncbi:hypothetical protein OG871_39200 [Kitasatospora sp. NBC_00374]|uniref:hypothetical protein n=1 Tax=Kitasatospora sp. NBC_00374 TaxID=2975964 RepID=UPI0030DE7402
MTSEAPLRKDDPSESPAPEPVGAACGHCGALLPPAPRGRPRAYCDLSCKSKAARHRIAQRPKPAAPSPTAAAAPPAPPGLDLLAAATDGQAPGPRGRVLELAESLAGIAYHFVRTLDDGDQARALATLRRTVPLFTAELLEQAQAAYDDAQAAAAPTPGGGSADREDSVFTKRRFETPGPGSGTTAVVPAPADGPTPPSAQAPDPAAASPARSIDGPSFSNRRFENPAPETRPDTVVPAPANGTTNEPSAAPGPAAPDAAERLDSPPVSNRRFGSRPSAAELEEARRVLDSPQVRSRVSPHLRDRTAPAAAPVPAAGRRPAPAPAPAPASAAPGGGVRPSQAASRVLTAPPSPYARGFGDCDVLLALPQLGPGWELAGWKNNRLAYYVVENGEIVGWVEIGIGAVPRWAAITDGLFLTDTTTGEPLFHTSPELAARTVRQARLTP